MSFSQTSQDINVSGPTLSAECEKEGGGSIVPSTLNLDDYLGNINASFRWGSTIFSHSARNISNDGPTLTADLQDSQGNWQSASVNLDEHIANMNGQLTYQA